MLLFLWHFILMELKIDFENQILALFDSYFWPFNKSHEKIKSIFVISAIIPSIWNVFIKFRWHDEKLIEVVHTSSHMVKMELEWFQWLNLSVSYILNKWMMCELTPIMTVDRMPIHFIFCVFSEHPSLWQSYCRIAWNSKTLLKLVPMMQQ